MTLTPEDIARLKDSDVVIRLRGYVVAHGAMHEDDCPCDDTCSCALKPVNDAVELVCVHLPSLLAAADRCGELESENSRMLDALCAVDETLSDLGEHRSNPVTHSESIRSLVQASESRATQAETRVRELEAEGERAADLQAKSIGSLMEIGRIIGVPELPYDEAAIVSAVTDLTTRLAAARAGLEKIEGYYNEFLGDIGRIQAMKAIARDTLARIGGEA